MARSFLPLLALFAFVGATAAFFKAAEPHQAAQPVMSNAFVPTVTSSFDEGLDNPNVASDMNIHPAASVASALDDPGRPIAQ
eukprot:CAMPEP_0171341288 /NCGR_PEP_ID=MMETSP0878-20121228/9901_1 /TAXON_ID=67004 /ORGANISM="Thalassiosira weissflogii, Strain CCMP1336" /LENGTH=81 /DNA_ID=CAMNT_0011843487 /DNA_START=70 /DNA_END=316 /DNA_ORIENTATION=+